VIVYVVYDSDPGNPYNVGIFGLLLQKKRIFLCSVCIKHTHTHTQQQQQQQQQKQEEQEKSLISHSCKFLYATYVFPSKESCSLLLHGLHKMD
jgi:hypothetical protein